MIDINFIWENGLIKGLNIQYPTYTYLKANQEGDLSPYPYVTVNCITPYKQDKDDIRGTISREAVTGDNTKVQINKTEEPQMVFSFSAYSDDEDECLAVLKDTIDWLTFSGQQYLESCGIVVLGCSPISDKTLWKEVDFQYRWGFDLTIRVSDTISKQVDTIDSVETINEN